MIKIRKGDTVQVVRGEDKGKKGKVLQVIASSKRALVEGVNFVKKHKRKTQQDQQGGITSIEAPVSVANLMFFCKSCNRPVRVGFSAPKGQEKSRFCKSCKEAI